MTYAQVLAELDKVNLKERFILDVLENLHPSLIDKLPTVTDIHSTPSLIRLLIAHVKGHTKDFWTEIFQWFKTPKFARPDIELIIKKYYHD